MKYQNPSTAPKNFKDFQTWILDELRHLSDAMSEPEVDTILLKVWHEAPDKLYDGLVLYADGTDFDPDPGPGGGRGVYAYEDGQWNRLTNN